MMYDSRPDTYEHINKVQLYLTQVITMLLWRGLQHDKSKLFYPEVEAFNRMTPILSTLTYGTEEYKQSCRELGPALHHHYAMNSHHPEHNENGIAGMSLQDLIEMVCDWKAASERMNPKVEATSGEREGETASLLDSLDHNAERFKIDPQLKSIIANTIKEMGWR